MSFPLNLYLTLGLCACVVSFLALPFWRAWSRRVQLMDEPGVRKIHHQSMPLAGGLAILTGLIIPLIGLAVFLQSVSVPVEVAQKMRYAFAHRSWQLGAIMAGAIGMSILGWWDDRHELRAAWKFAGQFIIASLVAAAGIRITLFVPNVAFSYLITILWLLTVTNAFTFMDNMNGLCSGLGLIAALLIGLISAYHGQYLVASLCFLTAGAVLGFLPYNFPRATAFLGDCGSHLLGYLMAVLGILPHFYTTTNAHRWAVLSPLLILALPLADLAWVTIFRWRLGKPFYEGDTNHLSHRLVRHGLRADGAVLLIWALAAALGALAFLLA